LPRYFFDVRSRFGRDEDLEGSELPNMDAALDEALAMAGRLQDRWSGVLPESQKDIAIEIVDEAGLTVMTLPFWQIERAGRLEGKWRGGKRLVKIDHASSLLTELYSNCSGSMLQSIRGSQNPPTS
jgi:hypothetical protein